MLAFGVLGLSGLVRGLQPFIGGLLSLFFGVPVTFLQLAHQLLAIPGNHVQVAVSELTPVLSRTALELLPLSFYLIPVHNYGLLSIGAADAATREGAGALPLGVKPVFPRRRLRRPSIYCRPGLKSGKNCRVVSAGFPYRHKRPAQTSGPIPAESWKPGPAEHRRKMPRLPPSTASPAPSAGSVSYGSYGARFLPSSLATGVHV